MKDSVGLRRNMDMIILNGGKRMINLKVKRERLLNLHEILGKGIDEFEVTVGDDATYLDVFNAVNNEYDKASEGKLSEFFPVFNREEIRQFRYENINRIKDKIDFVLDKREGDLIKRVHLIDLVEKDGVLEIKKYYEGRKCDTLEFFILENYMYRDGMARLVSQIPEKDKDTEIMLYLSKKLREPSTLMACEVENSRQFKEYRKKYLSLLLSSELYKELSRIDMNYYTDFIYNTINQICLINHCVEAPASGDKEYIIRCLWMDIILKRMQNIALILMVIPEVYVRNILGGDIGKMKYSRILASKLNIKQVFDSEANREFCRCCKNENNCTNENMKYRTNGYCRQKDTSFSWDDYYVERYIKGRTLKEMYHRLLQKYGFSSVDDIMEFALYNKKFGNSTEEGRFIGEFTHLFRVLYNLIKHASAVAIFKKLPDGEIIIHKTIAFGDVLEIDKLVDYIDVDVVKFKQSYGLRTYYNLKNGDVEDEKANNDFFSITLEDLEVMVKVLLAVLTFISMSSRL